MTDTVLTTLKLVYLLLTVEKILLLEQLEKEQCLHQQSSSQGHQQTIKYVQLILLIVLRKCNGQS